MSETTYKLARIDEGDKETYTLDEWLDAGGHGHTFAYIHSRTRAMQDNDALDEIDIVQHNKHIVERAHEEDAFYAEVDIPGWLTEDMDDIDADHPGATVRVSALVADYSDKAFQIIATKTSSMGDHWFNWCWEFVPKSQVTLYRGEGDATTEERHAHLEARDSFDDDWERASADA